MYFDFTLDEFNHYKGNYLLYRAMGQMNEAGSFIPPLSYLDAQQLPKRMVEMFLLMDDVSDKTIRQMTKKKGKQ